MADGRRKIFQFHSIEWFVYFSLHLVKELIHRYFHQLTQGCGRMKINLRRFWLIFLCLGNPQCSNIYCRSSLAFKYDQNSFGDDRNRAAAEAVQLYRTKAELCHRKEKKIGGLTENHLRELINYCRENDDWTNLQTILGLIFSNRMTLSTSFLKSDFVESMSFEPVSPPETSATPKSKVKFFISTNERNVNFFQAFSFVILVSRWKMIKSRLISMRWNVRSNYYIRTKITSLRSFTRH